MITGLTAGRTTRAVPRLWCRRGARAALAAMALAIATAACGAGAGARGGTTAGSTGATTAVAQCIRSHGVPDFPDPPGGGGPQTEEVQAGKIVVDGVTLKETPAQVQAAQQACQPHLGRPSTLTPTPQMASSADAFAACMRSHGISNFPDPTAGGGITLPPGTNPNSPPFQAAQTACQSLMPKP